LQQLLPDELESGIISKAWQPATGAGSANMRGTFAFQRAISVQWMTLNPASVGSI
jgi:hypothetical protein